jgi:hypothetical protein
VDAENAAQVAHVDGNGNLQVGGTVGIDPAQNEVIVDSSTPVSVTTDDDSGRQAFETERAANFENHQRAVVVFTVPDDMRLVIEYASFYATLVGTQSMQSFSIGTNVDHFIVPTFAGMDLDGNPIFLAGQDLRLYADGGTTVELKALRNADLRS